MLGKRAPGAKRPAKIAKARRVIASMGSGNPYKADQGLNVGKPQRFLSFPNIMKVCLPWEADTRYLLVIGPVLPAVAGAIATPYVFLDPLNHDAYVNNNVNYPTALKFFYTSDMFSLASIYQNMTFKTHVLNYTFSFDYSKDNLTDPGQPNPIETNDYILPAIDMAIGTLPITFLKDDTNTPHNAAQAGTLFDNVDYYSALTRQPGVKTYSLSQGSVRTISGSISIDALEHDGEPQTLASFQTWRTPFPTIPDVGLVSPDPAFRKVFLIALRMPELQIPGVQQTYSLRAAFRLDQHVVCFNKIPSFPYVVGPPGV